MQALQCPPLQGPAPGSVPAAASASRPLSPPRSPPANTDMNTADQPDPGDPGGPPRQVVVGRPANACLRCRRRKVKCPCEHPTCTPCVKAKAVCEYPSRKASVPSWQYVQRLEAKLHDMEQEQIARSSSNAPNNPLQALAQSPDVRASTPTINQQLPQPDSDPSPSPLPPRPAAHSRARADSSSTSTFPPDSHSHSHPHPHPHPNPHLHPHPPMPMAPPAPPSRLAPPSSAQLFNRLPSVADLDGIRLEAEVLDEEERYDAVPFAPAIIEPALVPSKDDLDAAAEYFVVHVNAAFPVLYEPSVRQTVAKMNEERDKCLHVDAFTVFALMAIWCASQSRGRSSRTAWSERSLLYANAARAGLRDPAIRPGFVRLQCQHLWLHYVLRNPEAGDIWALTGEVVRSAFDLGLHLESEGTARHAHHSPLELDMRRRLFWATYCIDHKVAVALGRPPGIVSDWISTRFPSTAPDTALDHPLDPYTPSHRKESVIHHIRLRVLQSDIYNRLFTVAASRSPPPPAEWFLGMGAKLDAWRTSYRSEPDEHLCPLWLELHYNLSRQLLYRPNPANPCPDRESLCKALEASSYLMRRYKAMWRARTINFVWLAIHHVFVSGVTYLNSIWLAAKHGWTIVPSLVEAMLDIQACSQVLEGMTDTQHGTMHMRDAFEVVSAAVIRHLSHRPTAAQGEPSGGMQSMSITAVTANGTGFDPASASTTALAQSDITSQPLAGGAGGMSMDQLFPTDFGPNTASASASASATLPWSDWAIDPSRPPSPSPGTDPSLATLDAFLFNPFGAVSADDLLSLQAGLGEYSFV